jgi:hypothetical protein
MSSVPSKLAKEMREMKLRKKERGHNYLLSRASASAKYGVSI